VGDFPLRQDLAVTGSVDHFGRVQAVGAINEKVEGFFDLCVARGLSGTQGVVIPAANVAHLMLREDVVAACAAGRFHVYATEHADEVLELLSGLPSGCLAARIVERLAGFFALRREYSVASGARAGNGDASEAAPPKPPTGQL
jgi:predicted ATP-dependent protease